MAHGGGIGERLLELEGVGFRYGGDVALEGIDLAIARGDRLAILGPNGGGKTTLLALLLGLVPPSSGARFEPPAAAGLRRAYVPQFPAFDRHFPVRVDEMVREGRLRERRRFSRPADDERAAVGALLERLDLAALGRAYLTELSGGELKRALIARAFAARPELLVLDEPSASLDEPSRRLLWSLIAELPAETAVVLATHDLAPGTFRATRALLVDRRIEELPLDGLDDHALLCGHGHG